MNHALLFSLALMLAACSPIASSMPEPDDAVVDGGEPRDAGTPDAAVAAPVDSGIEPFDAGVVVPADGGERLVVGMGPGQLVSWPFDTVTRAVGEPDVLDLGSTLAAVASQPGARRYYVVTEGPPVRISRVALFDDGSLHLENTVALAVSEVRALAFSRSGAWLFLATSTGLQTAPVASDGTIGALRSVRANCDAQAMIDLGGGVGVGTCRNENQLVRFDVSDAAGPTNARVQATLGGANPTGVVPWRGGVLVHGLRANGVPSSKNAAIALGTGATPNATVSLVPPGQGSDPAPFATVITRHPSLDVAYAVNGGAYAYGGNFLAVVRADAAGTLSASQYESLAPANSPNSQAAAVSPDGRWLLVGTDNVAEVRAWALDATGAVGTSQVVVLADDPRFIEVR